MDTVRAIEGEMKFHVQGFKHTGIWEWYITVYWIEFSDTLVSSILHVYPSLCKNWKEYSPTV